MQKHFLPKIFTGHPRLGRCQQIFTLLPVLHWISPLLPSVLQQLLVSAHHPSSYTDPEFLQQIHPCLSKYSFVIRQPTCRSSSFYYTSNCLVPPKLEVDLIPLDHSHIPAHLFSQKIHYSSPPIKLGNHLIPVNPNQWHFYNSNQRREQPPNERQTRYKHIEFLQLLNSDVVT